VHFSTQPPMLYWGTIVALTKPEHSLSATLKPLSRMGARVDRERRVSWCAGANRAFPRCSKSGSQQGRRAHTKSTRRLIIRIVGRSLLALSGHAGRRTECPLLGEERTPVL
jgi:hypothetical protein